MDARALRTPLTAETARALRAGERVCLSGTIYTARDAAHKRLCDLAARGEPMPFPLNGAVIYYAGPTPPPHGLPIGAAGPTTAGRMDAYAPTLIELGLLGMIGKGGRSAAVVAAMKARGAVYFGAIGGAGALLARCVQSSEVVCFADLGTEAVRRLEVLRLPVTVVIDSAGNNWYESGRAEYLAFLKAGIQKEMPAD